MTEVARDLLRALGDPVGPIDPYEIACACGLRVYAAEIPGARISGSVIEISSGATPQRKAELVAHALGFWALRRAGLRTSARDAARVGDALVEGRRALVVAV